ncbi:type II toxin-antitoxin system death-on-curing family toxin [Niabella ginsengisoli]|uniref:Fic family protein n=1 Tax=Niabella ginsengisoli TaxID=522298 RepID=A0ABS9SE51_9BACT|nr:Fic family protein [Niabella ginsengisoli]MCH5596601.1 Fic family protein [Niabella ginsengisoli]
MISLEDVLNLHDLSIDDFGGAKGVRDIGLLESAIARPFQTFSGDFLYPSPLEKAAALIESIIVNHPFIDGNKRTGVLAMIAVLFEYSVHIMASENALYDFCIKISTGVGKYNDIVEWLKMNTSTF